MYQVLLGEAGETDLVVVQMVCASIYTLVKHVKNHRAQRTLMTVARFRNRPGSWVASQSARLARLLLLLDLANSIITEFDLGQPVCVSYSNALCCEQLTLASVKCDMCAPKSPGPPKSF